MGYKNVLIFLIILFISVFVFVKLSYAITCAPGDVVIYIKDGKVVDAGTDGAEPQCLYGSDVVPSAFGDPISDPRANIRLAINLAMGFLGALVSIMIIYGGVMWLTAAGKEDQVTKGKHVLMWAAIGAIVISIAWTITSYVLQIGKTIG